MGNDYVPAFYNSIKYLADPVPIFKSGVLHPNLVVGDIVYYFPCEYGVGPVNFVSVATNEVFRANFPIINIFTIPHRKLENSFFLGVAYPLQEELFDAFVYTLISRLITPNKLDINKILMNFNFPYLSISYDDLDVFDSFQNKFRTNF